MWIARIFIKQMNSFFLLTGAPNVGRNELKRRLIASDPSLFTDIIPCKYYVNYRVHDCVLLLSIFDTITAMKMKMTSKVVAK